jgi:hypothetical protein
MKENCLEAGIHIELAVALIHDQIRLPLVVANVQYQGIRVCKAIHAVLGRFSC